LGSAKAAAATVLPLVTTSQSYGLGYVCDGVPVVDLHYLRLLFGGSAFMGDELFRFDDAAKITQSETLYTSQDDFERRLGALLTNPVTLARYGGTISWRREQLPEKSERDFGIMMAWLSLAPFSREDTPRLAEALRTAPRKA
jgi:hypothetical protein